MFYSASGDLVTNNIIEGFSSDFDSQVNAFKTKIEYDEIKDNYQIIQINSMINQVVKDAEYQLVQMDGKTEEQIKEIKKNIKDAKQYNNLLRILQYYSEQSFIMDDLYHNQDSLYNSILEIDGWSSISDEVDECEYLTEEIKDTVKKFYDLKKDMQDTIVDYKRLTKQKRDNC